jgi:hypothetical protein
MSSFFFGLVVAGVADDDFFNTQFLTGILEALDHGFHKLVILEDDASHGDVFGFHGALSTTARLRRQERWSGGSRNFEFFQSIVHAPFIDGGFICA